MMMQAGRRLLAEKMAKYKPVYSYRFDQPAENSTIEAGVRLPCSFFGPFAR